MADLSHPPVEFAVPEKSLSFARKLELRMPSALLPVKLYECRPFKRVADNHPTLVLTGVEGRLATLQNHAEILEWDGHPKHIEFRVDGQQFIASVWAFRKKVNVNAWRGSDGVVFALNGQTHATQRDDFFERAAVNMGTLRKSLFVVVDCSDISKTHEAALFMTSRDRLARSTFTDNLLKTLAEAVNKHPALKELRNERGRFAGTTDEQAQRSVQTFLENHLQQNPELGALLIKGKDIPNQHKPFTSTEQELVPLRKYPTFFRLRKADNGHAQRTVHLNRDYYRFHFETDAVDDYFDRYDAPGMKCLDLDGGSGTVNADKLIDGWYLSEGVAEMRLRLPDNAQEGDVLRFTFTVEDDNPETAPFVNTIELTIKPPKHGGDSASKKRPKRRPHRVDAPMIRPVYEEDWQKQPEPFDERTALRKVDVAGGYELRYNADNEWLRHEIKRLKSDDHKADVLRACAGR